MLDRLYGWQIEPEWLVWFPGLVSGLNVISRAVGEDDSGVLMTTPIYHPFLKSTQAYPQAFDSDTLGAKQRLLGV